MATFTGGSGNDSWTIVDPGTLTLDGLGGVDTVLFGTSLRSSYRITQDLDGAVHVDSISGASSALRATLLNIEKLVFNSGRDTVDVAVLFADTTAPTVSFSDNAPGTANNNVTYTVLFSEPVSGLATDDFTVTNGRLVSLGGNGSTYTAILSPSAGFEGLMSVSLRAAAVADTAGNASASASATAQPIDTRAPLIATFSPGDKAGTVAVGNDIVVTFNEAVLRGSGNVTIKDGAGTTVATYAAASSGNLSFVGSTLTINPAANLPFGTSFTLGFDAGSIKDLAGNNSSGLAASAFAGGAGYSFTTALDPANPKLVGTLANDLLTAGAARQSIDGLAGVDTVVLNGPRSAYTVANSLANNVSAASVAAKDASTSLSLTGVERLTFNDAKLALDLNGRAGDVAKILGAVFGKSFVVDPVFVGIGLQFADSGLSFDALTQLALDARLGVGASNLAVVNLLYGNVVGGAPSGADLANFVGLLDSQVFTQAGLAAYAAQTDLNQVQIGLVGLAQTGIGFV